MKNIQDLKGKKIAIDDVVTTYSQKKASHKSAWSYLLQAQLKHHGLDVDVLDKSGNIHDYDVWLIAMPMEFQGTYNLFGGAGDEPAARIARFLDFNGDIFCLNREMPDVGEFVRSRSKSCTENWKALDDLAISEKCKNLKTINLKTDTGTFVLGDSHSVSVMPLGSDISRNDGKTLFGALKEGFSTYIPEGTTHLISYFGNIDVRHHMCRQADPVMSIRRIAMDYIDHLKSLDVPNITVHKLLPIEFEGRRIPKTGWYKKAPFFGTREERANLVKIFNRTIQDLGESAGFTILGWPDHWYSENPESFAKNYMEKPGSVHLSREFYYWDWNTGNKNSNLIQKTASLF